MGRGVLPTLSLVLWVLVLFVAERIMGEGTARRVLVGVAAVGLLGSMAWRASLAVARSGDARRVELRLVGAKVGVLLALGLYALTTDGGLEVLGVADDPGARLPTVLTALWPAVFLVSAAALLFTELAYRRMPIAEAVELRRVRTAAQGGVGLALSLVFLFSINYVFQERDEKVDLSYFKNTKPSAGTLQMVDGLGAPLTVYLFYPEVNEVVDQLRPYFATVADASDQLEVKVRDHALAPGLAKDHRVRGNGYVVLVQGEGEGQQAEQFEVGTELDTARSRLKKLDASFQQAFMRLTRQQREIHLTSGHEELTDPDAGGDEPTDSTEDLMSLMRRSNISTRRLGMAQGLAHEVPPEAPALAVVGPNDAFLPEEARSMLRYVQQGGRVVVLVDPDVDHGLEPFLHGVGVQIPEGVLTSDEHYLRRTHTEADRANVFSNEYSAHPTVTMASRHAARLATIFARGGAVERYQGDEALPELRVVFPLKTGGDFWLDLDGDFELDDEAEKQGARNMMGAITVPNEEGEEGRVVVIPDGNFISDALIRNPGNGMVFGDVMQWFLGEEQIVGDASSEEDVRIEHTRDEDKVWFFATSFGAPLPLLAVGVWMAVRGRRRRVDRRGPKRPAREGGPSGGAAGDGGKEARS
ncbi:MAG: Gldg family protein [Myxococcota bacterium]